MAPVNPNETVAGQLNTDLTSGSPYLDLARSQSLAAASARGLQNSSIAAGAGEAAAIGAALPIAQQDATTNLTTQQNNLTAQNQFGQIEAQKTATEEQQAKQIAEQTGGTLATQAQQGEINTALQAQSEAANINQIIQQGNVNAMLQASANAFTAMQTQIANGQQITLANLNFQNQLQLTVAQGNIQSALSSQNSAQQIQQINATSQGTINQIMAQAAANASQDGPALQSQYLQTVSQIMQSTSQQIAAIYSTQGLTSDQQISAVATANSDMMTNIQNVQAYYASSPLWDTGQNPAPIPQTATAPGGAPPGPAGPPAAPGPAAPVTPGTLPAAPVFPGGVTPPGIPSVPITGVGPTTNPPSFSTWPPGFLSGTPYG